MAIDRRGFLRGSAGALAAPWLAGCVLPGGARGSEVRFQHGVASGDPGPASVVLWTRVTPHDPAASDIPVHWQVARDSEFARPVAAGVTSTSAARDWTVKLDVGGLDPATEYHYGFAVAGAVSPVGRTRTLPVGRLERLRLAFCSCSSLEWGFFGAYRHMAERDDLDAVLHLGDYIYEGGLLPHAPGPALGRVPEPDREILDLADYRARYACYRRDPDLQALHRRHPMIPAWDDHEFADNAWSGGASNHQPDEGAWAERRAAAVQAWREWMPVRDWDPAHSGPYRAFAFGDLADLLMLETRLGRDAQVLDRTDSTARARPERSLLGAVQERWLADELVASQRRGTPWRLLGQQVVFAPLLDFGGLPHNMDAWDGYPATRERLLGLWEERDIRDNVLLTGDVHSSWALDVPRDPRRPGGYDRSPGGDVLANEFVTPGVTARTGVPRERSDAIQRRMRTDNPNLHWVDLVHQGYALLDVDRERAACEWYHLEDVERRDSPVSLAARFRAPRGGAGLLREEPAGAAA